MIVSTPTRVWSFKRLPLIKKYCESDMLIFFLFFLIFQIWIFPSVDKTDQVRLGVCMCEFCDFAQIFSVCFSNIFWYIHKYHVLRFFWVLLLSFLFVCLPYFLWWFYVLFDWFFVIKLFTFIFLTFLQLLPVSLPWFDWLFVSVFSFLLFSQIVYLFYSTDWFLFCYSFS